jgi:mannose/cellobiose epimerase-like protein (N-acyl-D-glucosamine 2-epimerase family)
MHLDPSGTQGAALTEASVGLRDDSLRDWLVGPAAALWLDRGLDRKHGGYFDSLTIEGAENSSDFKRLRVTCRQIFVFSRLDMLGVTGAREAMLHGVDFLLSRLRHAGGGFIRSVTLKGQPLDERRDLYDLAFTIFALAAAHERTGNQTLCDEALAVLTFIRHRLAHGAGGYLEGLPATLPRRQNPHMHLLEACLAWLPLSGEPAFRDVAQGVLDLMAAHLWSPADQCLFEYFGEDWQLCADLSRRVFEPGHHFEWAWLLEECRAAGLITPDLAGPLARRAFHHGFSSLGLPYAEVRPDGAVADRHCRIWVITEWLRAQVTHCAYNVPAACKAPGATPLDVLKRFLDVPTRGLWYERCDAVTGRFVNEAVPASSLYHIVTGVDTFLQVEVRDRSS